MARSEARREAAAVMPQMPAIEAVGAADIPAALALSDAALWNQTADDWAFFIARGRVVGCRDEAGRLVATAAALPYDGGIGWVSMVLVDADWRHRGLATMLLDACTAHLRSTGRIAALDATPAGAPVYRRLGFSSGLAFERWQGPGSAGRDGAPEAVREAERGDDDDEAAIVDLDAAAAGFSRGTLIRALLARPGTRAWRCHDGSGFVVARAGRRATQLGPLVAASADDAIALLAGALGSSDGPVFVDLVEPAGAVAAWLSARGFTRQRPFVRMAQQAGAPVLVGDPRVHAVAGPEFG